MHKLHIGLNYFPSAVEKTALWYIVNRWTLKSWIAVLYLANVSYGLTLKTDSTICWKCISTQQMVGGQVSVSTLLTTWSKSILSLEQKLENNNEALKFMNSNIIYHRLIFLTFILTSCLPGCNAYNTSFLFLQHNSQILFWIHIV